MSAAAALMEPSFGMDKLSYEIFSILESKFLFDDPKFLLHATAAPAPVAMPSPRDAPSSAGCRVRVLSVDASGATDGLFAAASLARLECSLKKLSGEPSARIADFFDVAAGSGVGGVLVALLFTRGPAGRPLFSAAEAVEFLAHNRRALQPMGRKKSVFSAIFRRSGAAETTERLLRRVLGDATLRDTVKPVLIPCYDLSTGAPFLFSRADAVETDGYDFLMREVCAATVASAKMRSVDGRTAIDAVDGGVAAGNPAAAAITHVLNNRMEFPFVTGVDDLLLVSLGNGAAAAAACGRQSESRRGPMSPSRPDIVKIAGEGASDMVDQAVSMAFGPNRTSNYVRIQASVRDSGRFRACGDAGEVLAMAEGLLAQKNVESVLFQGRRVSERSNAERLEWASAELIREHECRKKCPIPVVVFKQGSPRSSSCSALSSCSGSPIPAAASPR